MFEKITNESLPLLNSFLSKFGITFDRDGVIWILIYVVLVLFTIAVSRFIGRKLADHLDPQLRKIRGQPRLLRFLANFKRRLPVVVFCILIWFGVYVLKHVPWTGHDFALMIVASLTSAWLVIDLLIRFIRNQFVAKLFGLVVWCIAALNILHLTPEVIGFLDQFSINIGGFHSTFLSTLKGLLVLCLAVWLALYLGRVIERQLGRIDDLSPSLKVLLSKFLRVALIIIAILVGMGALGINLTALTVLSGALGLGIGFGLKEIIANIVSGVILITDKSIKPGDVISVETDEGESFGRINYLAGRYVSVVARNGREYLIPNEELITRPVVNWSYSNNLVRQDIAFGVSYHDDPHKVRELACEVAANHPRVESEKAPVCHITEFGDSSINFLLRFWISDPANGITNIKGDIFLALWDAFKENNIEIPYPHRQVLMKSDAIES